MNRAARRAMERTQRRQYRPPREVNVPAPMMLKIQLVLAPLEAIIDEIERDGTVDTINGTPVFRALGDESWYASHPAIIGIVELFEEWCRRTGRTVEVRGLKRLANKLQASMPLAESDISDVRREMVGLRRAVMQMTHAEAIELVEWTQRNS